MGCGLQNCQIAAGVLAGGKGRRFGRMPKGLWEVAPGIPILRKQVAELASSGIEEVIILTNDPRPYRGFGRNIVPDLRAGIGPLGGIETAISYYFRRCRATLFLPCDLPYITAQEITSLLEGFSRAEGNVAVAVSGESDWEPLFAVVKNELLPVVQAAIDRGVRRVREVWKELGVTLIHFPDRESFCNVNTPKDLPRWAWKKGGGN
ncbi:MAG: molybdenum cofactor guanylyltransferase [candidate division NC10 bacterium]|nr:molybdenum cofactor guanylyltransferase [candidate division NC10 bacterium]